MHESRRQRVGRKRRGGRDDWILSGMDGVALEGLENAYLAGISEATLSEDARACLSDAIRMGRIVFFVARLQNRAIGMCSVARCFSTFACANIGIFDDFFVEPEFRKKGVARRLASAAQAWCAQNGVASLTVTCAPCGEPLYQSLGFTTRLGTAYAKLS